MSTTFGWVLLPVAVEEGHELEQESYEFENGHAWHDANVGGAWGFISTKEAPNMQAALDKMQRADL